MSSFTFADNKLGGRITASCDAIAAGHLNRAAGILAELADELNVEATEAGLLSEEAPAPVVHREPEPPALQLNVAQVAAGMEMCTKNVHSYGKPDPVSGWRVCSVCEMVNVAPDDNSGAIDMSVRQ